MTVITIHQEAAGLAIRPRLAAMFGHEPVFAATGFAMLFLMLPTGFAAMVDGRMLDGVNVWAKPLKFQASIAAYVLTLAFFARYMPRSVLAARWYGLYAVVVAASAYIEMVWLMGASLIGTISHFNPSPVGAALYPVMGALALLLTTASAVQAWHIARNPASGLSPALKDGLVLGLALVLPLTLVTAGTLANLETRIIGDIMHGSSVPLMGWSREAGDLRVAHFFATHAMQFVPAFALVSVWLWGGERRLPVRLFAFGFAAFTIATFVQALAGMPFLPV